MAHDYISRIAASGIEFEELLTRLDEYNAPSYTWIEIYTTSESPLNIEDYFNITVDENGNVSDTSKVGVFYIENFLNGPTGYTKSSINISCIPHKIAESQYKIVLTVSDNINTWICDTSFNWVDVTNENYEVMFVRADNAPTDTTKLWIDTSEDTYFDIKSYKSTSSSWDTIFTATDTMLRSIYDTNGKQEDIFLYILKSINLVNDWYTKLEDHINNLLTLTHITQEQRDYFNNNMITIDIMNELFDITYRELMDKFISAEFSKYYDIDSSREDIDNLVLDFSDHVDNHFSQKDIDLYNSKSDAYHTHFVTEGEFDVNSIVSGVIRESQLPYSLSQKIYAIDSLDVLGSEDISDYDKLTIYKNYNKLFVEDPETGDTTWYIIIDSSKIGTSEYLDSVLEISFNSSTISFNDIQNPPTTLEGYGFTDETYSKDQISEMLLPVTERLERMNKIPINFDPNVLKNMDTYAVEFNTGDKDYMSEYEHVRIYLKDSTSGRGYYTSLLEYRDMYSRDRFHPHLKFGNDYSEFMTTSSNVLTYPHMDCNIIGYYTYFITWEVVGSQSINIKVLNANMVELVTIPIPYIKDFSIVNENGCLYTNESPRRELLPVLFDHHEYYKGEMIFDLLHEVDNIDDVLKNFPSTTTTNHDENEKYSDGYGAIIYRNNLRLPVEVTINCKNIKDEDVTLSLEVDRYITTKAYLDINTLYNENVNGIHNGLLYSQIYRFNDFNKDNEVDTFYGNYEIPLTTDNDSDHNIVLDIDSTKYGIESMVYEEKDTGINEISVELLDAVDSFDDVENFKFSANLDGIDTYVTVSSHSDISVHSHEDVEYSSTVILDKTDELLDSVQDLTFDDVETFVAPVTNKYLSLCDGRTVSAFLYPEIEFEYDTTFNQISSTGMLYYVTKVIFANGLFVSIGRYYIRTSPDGITWTNRYTPSTSYYMYDITYRDGLFVVSGNYGVIVTSPDGITWTLGVTASSSYTYYSNTYNEETGKYLAVGVGTSVVMSDNGTTWTRYTNTTGLLATDHLWSVTYHDGLFIAVGSYNRILTSPDGLNWTQRYATTSSADYLSKIIYNDGKYLAVGTNSLIMTSTDLENWTIKTAHTTAYTLKDIICVGEVYYAPGTVGMVLVSTDLENWTTKYVGSSLTLFSITYHSGAFYIANYSGSTVLKVMEILTLPSITSNTNSYSYIYTGKRGEYEDLPYPVYPSANTALVYSITQSSDLYVTCGYSGTILTSSDAINWTSRTSGVSTVLYENAYIDGQFIAVGASGVILTSPDAITWTKQTSGVTTNIYAVTGTSNILVAVGISGTIFRSTDNGITWIKQTSPTSANLWGVKYCNGQFIATGANGVILTSPDAITWTSRTSTQSVILYSALYQNGLYVVVGASGRVLTSPDAITWTLRTTPNSLTYYNISYVDEKYVVIDVSGNVITSPDAITWTTKYASAKTNYINNITIRDDGKNNTLILPYASYVMHVDISKL